MKALRKPAPRCDSCEALMINGIYCHESGCPDMWKTKTYLCKWCGAKFTPEEKHQICCCDSCAENYNT